MNKLISLLILLTYIALAPLCFADSTTMTHDMHGGGSAALATDYPTHPIAHHADMYEGVTSAVGWSVLFVVLVFLCVAVHTDTRELLRIRIRDLWMLKLGYWRRVKHNARHSTLHWLVLHIASPNSHTRCA